MPREIPIIRKYSIAFKRKVVSEVESGKFSLSQAGQIYDINGSSTISGWMRKFGKAHLISKVVRIEMKDEKNIIKHLKKEKKELESALAQTQMKALVLESLVEIAKEEYGIDLKKNTGKKQSPIQKKSSRRKSRN